MKTKVNITLLKSVSIMVVFCAWLVTAKAQTISLQQQSDYTVGVAAQTPRIAVGDVNNDRLPDLVTLNPNNLSTIGPISVFLNNGAGGFGSPINIVDNTGLSPTAVVIGDYNRDGNPDLAISNTGIANGINIRLGNGTGNFPTGTFIAAERGSPVITSADYSGDGNLDLAICNNVNELRVLNGNGTGGFGAAASFTTANVCQDLVTADFNVDGKPDLAVSMRLAPAAQGVQVFLSSGASFNAPVNVTASSATTMITGDFNRDCIPDLAVAAFASTANTSIYILLGNGAGNFTSTTVTLTNFPRYMAVGDFNRDKKVDLAIRRNSTVAGANNLTILPGNGNGTFGTAFEFSIAVPTSTNEMQIAALDANRDGRDDLVIGRQGGFLLYNGNSALFTRTENDFDGDLKSDLSVFRPSNTNWYVNRSTNGFMSQQFGLASDKLTPADYDGDGKTDIAIWREGAPFVAAFWILQSSDNTVRIVQFGQTGDDSTVVADWDGDGKADPAIYRSGVSGAQSFFYYRGSLNNPNGNITYLSWGTSGDAPVRGDFDGDGKQDAAIFRPSNAVWYVLQSSNAQLIYQNWGLTTDKRVTGDYDGDGKTDFAVFRPSNNTWYVRNSSNSVLSYRQWGLSSDVLTPGDYNGDGTTDTAIYRPSDQRWYVPQCANFNTVNTKFGSSGDTAVPSAFVP